MTFRHAQLGEKEDRNLVEQRMPNIINVEKKITVNMGVDDSLPFKLGKGFSGAETTHRWTEGFEAVLTVSMDNRDKNINQIIFDTYGMVSEKISQQLIISIQGIEIKTYEYNVSKKDHKVILDMPVGLSGDIDIYFKMPNACKPYETDPTNKDQRLLAIAFTSATVVFNDQAKQYNEFESGRITQSQELMPKPAYAKTSDIQSAVDLYVNNNISINEFIDRLLKALTSCQIIMPAAFNLMNFVKEIARHPVWQNQGSRAIFFSKTPDGIADINIKNPETLTDCKKVIDDCIKRSSSHYVHGARSKMTSEFYDLILQLGKEGMSERMCFLALSVFCHKWKLAICSFQLDFLHDQASVVELNREAIILKKA